MNSVDKILLGLLVLLLPIGIWVSHALLTQNTSSVEKVQVGGVKLKEMVGRFSKLALSAKEPTDQLIVSRITYATQSGKINLEGKAPSSEMTVMMSVTVLPPEAENSDDILGFEVEHVTLPTSKTGAFKAAYPIIRNGGGIVEIRLEQNEMVKMIRFDLDKNIQLF